MTRSSRLQVLAALAHCELQRGHTGRARAWLRAIEDESIAPDDLFGCVDWPLHPVFLQLALLADYEPLTNAAVVTEQPSGNGSGPVDHLRAWSRALSEPDPAVSLHHLDDYHLSGPGRDPLLVAQVKLTSALKQQQLGATELAGFNFRRASEEFQRLHAYGWSALVASHLDRLPAPARGSWGPAVPAPVATSPVTPAAPVTTPVATEVALAQPDPSPQETDPVPPGRGHSNDTALAPSREIRLLGDFSVLCNGTPAPVPLGRAAQALKVVALFRRISVDELAEVLWPGAEPGVGTRRLRNILWRIKSSSGDLLCRRENFICLDEGVVTDVTAFEEAAGRAFKEPAGTDGAHDLAREALGLYGGELLPSDRYEDWTAGPREALIQIRLQLLDLMLTRASESGNRQAALALLEDLIDADPYEERYYTQLATLHLEAGNRSRVRASLARCERMLEDLGVEPSKHFLEFVRELEQR